MSSTRHANNGSPLRQEKFASDPAFNNDLKASAVARKCRLLSDPIHKELCLHLQYISMQPGGLTLFVADFLKHYGNRVGSPTMRKHMNRKIFGKEVVRTVRSEIHSCTIDVEFPLKGEAEDIDPFEWEVEKAIRYAEEGLENPDTLSERIAEIRAGQQREADCFPDSYPAATFFDHCLDRAKHGLEEWLIGFCLDPDIKLDNPPTWFNELEKSIIDYFNDCRADSATGQVVTAIGKEINDALDYALEERCMVHINGMERLGKTHQVKQWCAAHPGRARYIQVPSGQDDLSFFREIGRALGTAAGSSLKTTQIRQQLEDAIQDSGLMLVFDEAHLLWPQNKSSRSAPRRISWLMTAVVNKGVSAALISTPQFDKYQKRLVECTGWADGQLEGRIAFRCDLPDILPRSDLAALAAFHLPEAGKEIIDALCDYAEGSGKYLAGIEWLAKRARFVARRFGRSVPDKSDVRQAMRDVDPAITRAAPQKEPKVARCKPPAKTKQRVCGPAARVVHSSGKQLETVA